MKRRSLQFIAAVTITVIALTPAFLIGQQSPRQLFERAKIVEEANTDLTQAIRLYEQAIVQSKDRALTAEALLRMGGCYEKLGSAEASKAYERITKDFSDQREVAADAGRRLLALGNPPTGKPAATRTLATNSVTSFTSISSDGRWMATTDKGDVAIRDLSTGQLARLEAKVESKGLGGAERAVLSPDLKQVAYSFWTGVTGTGYQLRIIPNVVGSTPSILSDNPEFDFYYVLWFPDGKSLLATAVKPDKTWQLVRVFLSDHSIKVLTSLGWRGGGQGVPGLPTGPFPSLSPDGRYIAYTALAVNPSKFPPPATDPKDLHIYILPTDGSGHEIELAKNANSKFPVWTPDGSRVVFTSDASGKWDLWSVPIQNGKAAGALGIERRDVGEIQPIGMSRSGSFYYIRSLPAVAQFSIAEITPGGGSRILETPVGTSPIWSPNGNSVAFFRRSVPAGNSDLVVRDVESGTEKVYASGPMRTSPATWFHDGRGLLLQVAEPQAGVTSVFFADTSSGEFKQILPPLPDTRRGEAMALSPDDKTVYYTAGEIKTGGFPKDRIIAVDLSSGQSRTAFVVPGTLLSLGGVSLSPDGRMLAMTGIDPERKGSHLALVRVDGSGYQEIYGPFRTPSESLAWTKDGREIVFSTLADDGTPQIMRIGIDGGKPRFTGLVVKGLNTFAISPDDSRIAFNSAAATSSTSELLALDNFSASLKDSK